MPIVEYDGLIADIDKTIQELAVSVVPKWWGTIEYCLLFPKMFRAERLYMRTGPNMQGAFAYCYNERNWLLGMKMLELLGPLQSPVSDIRSLLIQRKAQVAVIHYVRTNDLCNYAVDGFQTILHRQGADLVLNLPNTFAEYLEQLGESTRENLKKYFRRLHRELKAVALQTYMGEQIEPCLISQILDFNRQRLETKGKVVRRTSTTIDLATDIARRKGLLVALFNGDELLAGTLSYIHKGEAYFVFIGHNQRYDYLNLGKVALAFAIEELIKRRISRAYLHYGHNPYKLYLGAQEEPVFQLIVCRDRVWRFIWNVETSMQKWARGAKKLAGGVRRRLRQFGG